MKEILMLTVYNAVLAAAPGEGRPVIVSLLLYIGITILICGSITALIVCKDLTRTNTMGDQEINYYNYGSDPDLHGSLDRTSRQTLAIFKVEHGVSPFIGNKGSGPAALSSEASDANDIYGDLPEVDKPLFAPPKE